MAGKKREFTVVNINKRGEVFDPATVTIRAGDVPGLEIALRQLIDKIAEGGENV